MNPLDLNDDDRLRPYCYGVMVFGLLALVFLAVQWCGDRDERGMATHPPMQQGLHSAPANSSFGPETLIRPGWPRWPSVREKREWGALHALQVSSYAIELQDDQMVVVNAPEAVVQQPGSGMDDWPWPQLRHCEATGRWDVVSPNGKWFGAYQFDQPTWNGAVARAGHPEWSGHRPSHAPPHVQHAAAVRLHSERGFQPWPGCRSRLGL